MAERKLAITRTFSLGAVDESWKECYIKYTPASLREMQELSALQEQELSDSQSADLLVATIKKHFVSGKVMLLDESGNATQQDADRDDVESLPTDIIKDLFLTVVGGNLDPKATPPAAPSVA